MELKFKKLHPLARLPEGHWDSVGWDIRAFRLNERGSGSTILVPARATINIPTGLAVEPPPGYYVQVHSRSGLASKSIWVANAPGIIDPDYRGEIKVLLYNGSHEAQWIKHEDRIAQLILVQVVPVTITEVEALSETRRGEAGFGSTGDS